MEHILRIELLLLVVIMLIADGVFLIMQKKQNSKLRTQIASGPGRSPRPRRKKAISPFMSSECFPDMNA